MTTTTTASIPVVDLRRFQNASPQEQQTFVRTVGDALRDVGFFAVTNHGVDMGLVDKAYHYTRALFDLPEATKKTYENLKIGGQRGYTSFGREHAKDSDAPDLKEFWHVGQELANNHPLAKEYPANIWPQEIPEFQPVMTELYKQLGLCSDALLQACALYIGEEKNFISKMSQDGNTILRLIHYPPIAEDVNPKSIRAAAHEDINLITLLLDATSSGLELLRRDNTWMPVVTPPGCIIVDAGDMLQNLTNGYFKSTTHRVVNPQNSRERRFSMPYFVHPRGEVSLNPLANCVAKTGGKATFPNISAGDYLAQRLREIGLTK